MHWEAHDAQSGAPTLQQVRDALVQRHGMDVQQRLEAARVGVAGLGGLGSNIAVSLTRAGIGSLVLVDFDVVDLTNLNRQQYFADDLGLPKTEALPRTLRRINPYLGIETHQVRVTSQNACQLFEGCDVVCEAFDRPEGKAMLLEALQLGMPQTPLVCGSGMAGWGNSNGIRTRKLFGNVWMCGDERTEPTPGAGLMAPRVAICANHEANMVLQLLPQQ